MAKAWIDMGEPQEVKTSAQLKATFGLVVHEERLHIEQQ
jgi:hypothetical protein